MRSQVTLITVRSRNSTLLKTAYRIAVTVLLCIAAAIGIAGCDAVVGARPGPVHVEVWTMWTGDEENDFLQVVSYYNRTHPGVVVENLSGVTDSKTTLAIVAAASPDLCTLADASSLGTLAANNAVTDLDSDFKSSGLTPSAYTPGSLGMATYKGHLYALPYLNDCNGLLYNKDVFRKVGLDPDRPPRTMEELMADCKRITKHDADGRLVRIGFQPVDAPSLFAIYGGGVLDENGNVIADNPRNIEAATYYKRIMDAQGGYQNVIAFTSGFANAESTYNAFFAGDVGIVFSGEWNPYLAYHYSPNTHYGIAPLPYPAAHPELAGTVTLGSNLLCIPKGAKHPKEAWDFLQWTQSVKGQELLASTLHNVPNIRAVLHDPVLRKGAPWRPYFAQFMDMSDNPNAWYFPPTPVASLYTNQLANAMDSICYGNRDPKQALAAVRARVQRELDQYGKIG